MQEERTEPLKDQSLEKSDARSRRDILKTGAMVLPTIVTLYSAPSWARGNSKYTRVAYQYGINAGKCRNPNFDPRSNRSWKQDEFMPCDEIKRDWRRRGGSRRDVPPPDETTPHDGKPKDIIEL